MNFIPDPVLGGFDFAVELGPALFRRMVIASLGYELPVQEPDFDPRFVNGDGGIQIVDVSAEALDNPLRLSITLTTAHGQQSLGGGRWVTGGVAGNGPQLQPPLGDPLGLYGGVQGVLTMGRRNELAKPRGLRRWGSNTQSSSEPPIRLSSTWRSKLRT